MTIQKKKPHRITSHDIDFISQKQIDTEKKMGRQRYDREAGKEYNRHKINILVTVKIPSVFLPIAHLPAPEPKPQEDVDVYYQNHRST